MAARIRKGDTVVVISGKDKGRTGKVKQVNIDLAPAQLNKAELEQLDKARAAFLTAQ